MGQHWAPKEVARKYDARKFRRNSELALRAMPVHVDSLRRVLSLAATYGLDDLVATCHDFIAATDDSFHSSSGGRWQLRPLE